jgi:hypothetical protein
VSELDPDAPEDEEPEPGDRRDEAPPPPEEWPADYLDPKPMDPTGR